MSDLRSRLFALEFFGIKLGLDAIRALLDRLGRPDRAYPSVIVAGTNGKGSTAAMVERGLRAAGYRTGRYTSPHLVSIEERIAIDGVPIDAAVFDRATERMFAAAAGLDAPPTFFEATTAIALDVFRQQGVDIAVLEVGLGGRLDATNAVDAIAAAITSVDFDHEALLGSTIEAIAAEKAGVIKPGQSVVLAGNPATVVEVVRAACEAQAATLVPSWEHAHVEASVEQGRTRVTMTTPGGRYESVVLGLRGRHQIQNAVTAVRLLETLRDRHGLAVTPDAVRVALEQVEWPARLEWRVFEHGHVLIDGAHNPAGASVLAAYVRETFGRAVPFVVGAMADKNIEAMAAAFAPAASHVVATAPHSPRAATPHALASVFTRVAPDLAVSVAADPPDALRAAAAHGDPVVVAGSLYLAGEVRLLL